MFTRTNTFVKNLILFLVPLLIPILILGAFSIIITTHYIQNEITKNNFNLLKQTKINLEIIFDELDSLNLNFGTNPEIVVNLKRIFDSPNSKVNLEEYHSLTTISHFIEAPANARPYIHSIYVYFDNNQEKLLTTIDGLTSLNRFFDTSWFQSYLTNKSQDIDFWSEARQIKEYSFKKNPTPIWTIYRKIYSTSRYKKCVGVIVLNIYTDYLKKILANFDIWSDQHFFIVDQANQIVFTNSKTNILNQDRLIQILSSKNDSFTLKFSGILYAISKTSSRKYALKYISIIPLNVLYKVPYELKNLTIIFLFISFGLGVILTYYLTRRNYNQVKDIIAIIDSAANERPLPSLPSSVKDEYGYITHNILKTFIEQNYLKIQLSERKYRLQFMELLALQSQINPHFLFNTLETIKWKIFQLTNKPNQATKMLEDLAEILHYSLESPGLKVKVAEEIHNTKNYIKIQKIRYRDKFNVMWEYDEHINQFPIIRLLFQPLLENCIYHGIKEKNSKSVIKIKIRYQEDSLKISIIDNGLGIIPEKLKELRNSLKSNQNPSEHIGLFNTNKRLILTYGETAAIHIRSKYRFGTVVFFRIPVDKK